MRLIVVAVALMIAAPSPAQAARHHVHRARIALPRPPLPPIAVEHVGQCPDTDYAPPNYAGCAYVARASALFGQFWVISAGDVVTVSHEQGHLYDAELLDDGERHAIASRGHGPWPWDVEWFADTYAQCRLGWRSPIVMVVNHRRARLTCATIKRAADTAIM